MIRALPILLLSLLAAPALLADDKVTDYHDTIYLFDHETARYRLAIEDYGAGENLHVDVYVRGIDAPPRVRILEENRDEVKRREDTSGDNVIHFNFTADSPHPRYYVELDSALQAADSHFELRVKVTSSEGQNASADMDFQKVFTDFDDGGKSDHVNCAASSTGYAGSAALLLALAGLLAVRRRKAVANP